MALPIAYLRNLETALDPNSQRQVFQLTAPANEAGCVDFGSNNTLSLGGSKAIRNEFLRELARNPNFEIGTGCSRVLGGSTRYACELERDLALYNNADDGLIFPSGYEGNSAIHATLPQKGDVFIHDAKIHASTREGMRASKAETIRSFAHNDPQSLFEVIEEVKLSERGVSNGHNTAFVTLESIYSMDGDIAPLMELTAEAKRALPKGNLILVLDEAHSHGMIGPNGAGLACHLGLENEFAVRLHTYGKAAGASGGKVLHDASCTLNYMLIIRAIAIVLCNGIVKRYLVSHARNLIFTTVPSFVFFATIRAATAVMTGEEGNLVSSCMHL